MEGKGKTIVYVITAAVIFGIVIAGALVLTSETTEEGFSELYFKDPDMLPRVIKVGDMINFAFTTASHEKRQTAYKYRVIYDGHDIMSGYFSLEPSSFKTINVSIMPKNSSLVKKTDLDPVVNLSKMKMDANMPGKFILPIRLQDTDSACMLVFDLKQKESYNTSLRTLIPKVVQAPSGGPSISNLGYTMHRDDWNIVNDRGNIDIIHNTSSTIYRYVFNNVSVEVSSTRSDISRTGKSAKTAVSDTRMGSKYEIHFWHVVKEDPDKLQNMVT